MDQDNDTEDMDSLHTFCKSLPKIELHAHLNGSIREHTLLELANERNVTLPPKCLLHEAEHHNADTEALFFNTKPRSLLECFDIFAVIPQCVNDLMALRRITTEVLEDAANDNVVYMEIRTGPKVLLRDHRSVAAEAHHQHCNYCTKKEYVETIISIMNEFEREDQLRYQQELEINSNKEIRRTARLPLIPRLIISVDRSGTIDQAMENTQLAIDMFRSSVSTNNKYIVGVELGGNPTRNDFRAFKPAFDMARREGLPISIHCGEIPMGLNGLEKDETLLSAYQEAVSIIEFRPERLGHGLLLSEMLMKRLTHQPIPIECCPTSNVMTLELSSHHGGNLIDGMKIHPQLGKWLENGYPISINTDDSGLFNTNLTREILLVAKAFHLGKRELVNIILNSVDHIFDPSGETKSRLRKDVADWIQNATSTVA